MAAGPARRPHVGSLLWLVAFAAMGIAALTSAADVPGVIGLLTLGHALMAIAVVVDAGAERGRVPPDATLLLGVLAAFAAVEGLGWLAAWNEGERGQSTWFAAALSFAAAGAIASRRGGASDGAVAAQMFFHCVMIVPGLAALSSVAARSVGSSSAIAAFSAAGPVARLLLIVSGVAMPPLFASLMAVLAHGGLPTSDRRSAVWPSLLAHEAAFAVIAARWAYNGL